VRFAQLSSTGNRDATEDSRPGAGSTADLHALNLPPIEKRSIIYQNGVEILHHFLSRHQLFGQAHPAPGSFGKVFAVVVDASRGDLLWGRWFCPGTHFDMQIITLLNQC
jgi:hypothetical protein